MGRLGNGPVDSPRGLKPGAAAAGAGGPPVAGAAAAGAAGAAAAAGEAAGEAAGDAPGEAAGEAAGDAADDAPAGLAAGFASVVGFGVSAGLVSAGFDAGVPPPPQAWSSGIATTVTAPSPSVRKSCRRSTFHLSAFDTTHRQRWGGRDNTATAGGRRCRGTFDVPEEQHPRRWYRAWLCRRVRPRRRDRIVGRQSTVKRRRLPMHVACHSPRRRAEEPAASAVGLHPQRVSRLVVWQCRRLPVPCPKRQGSGHRTRE